jgi:hypothetical protein
MKFHLTQKIGLAGIAFVSLIALVFYLGGYFSPFIFAATIPFCVLILIGYSINNSRK